MTPAPDTIGADASCLDALHVMHDRRYLHLPVVDGAGRVLGVVDVVEVMYATTAGGGDAGGWATLLAAPLDDDASSETSSVADSRPASRKPALRRGDRGATSTSLQRVSDDRPPGPRETLFVCRTWVCVI